MSPRTSGSRDKRWSRRVISYCELKFTLPWEFGNYDRIGTRLVMEYDTDFGRGRPDAMITPTRATSSTSSPLERRTTRQTGRHQRQPEHVIAGARALGVAESYRAETSQFAGAVVRAVEWPTALFSDCHGRRERRDRDSVCDGRPTGPRGRPLPARGGSRAGVVQRPRHPPAPRPHRPASRLRHLRIHAELGKPSVRRSTNPSDRTAGDLPCPAGAPTGVGERRDGVRSERRYRRQRRRRCRPGVHAGRRPSGTAPGGPTGSAGTGRDGVSRTAVAADRRRCDTGRQDSGTGQSYCCQEPQRKVVYC